MVTYLTPTVELDPYSGLPVGEDWGNPVRTEAPSAFVLSSTTSVGADNANQTTTTTWTLYVPEGEISPPVDARIEFDGEVFTQNGKAIREVNPFTGWAPYAQVRLTRSEGKG